jgi:hypothetical protein
MTLLEAMIAFVLLSVVGVVCLDQARGASQLQVSSAEWSRAVMRGERAVADAMTDGASGLAEQRPLSRSDVRVVRRPWRGRVDAIEVFVPLANGATYRLTRLVARDAPQHTPSLQR